jgi:hypothetical protein
MACQMGATFMKLGRAPHTWSTQGRTPHLLLPSDPKLGMVPPFDYSPGASSMPSFLRR